MKKLFGTDGIRAVAGEYPLDYPAIHALGAALVGLLREEGLAPDVLIGRDTRESGPWMEQALVQGIREAKGRPLCAGIVPTSAVSLLTKRHHFNAGIVISASHNPFHDNGIKIFSSEGIKISDAWETRLEDVVIRAAKTGTRKSVGHQPHRAFTAEYAGFLKGSLGGGTFPRKMKVVLDCANGAAAAVAPGVLGEMGLDVVAIGCAPDGRNINRGCGSLHPHQVAQAVVEARADMGIAYDGDADRALWADETGRILNGDHTLYVLAQSMIRRGTLRGTTIVATGMSNMGLETALSDMGLSLFRTKVGDKYVLEKMMELGANLGGEQSGHTILLDECPTGDGILTSLKMLQAMAETDRPLSGLVAGLQEFPQILLNVPVARKEDFRKIPEVAAAIDRAQAALEGHGRLEVRYSGTEPLARVMVEGNDLDAIQIYAHAIADAIRHSLGSGLNI
jgi:phosphoglucosamine mutase